jgi:hypothetical protein
MRPPSAPFPATLATLAAAAVLVAGCAHGTAGPAARGAGLTGQAEPAATAAAGTAGRPPVAPAGGSLIATLKGTVPRFTVPGGKQDGTVAARWYGAKSVLPVIAGQPGWYQVRLATRPNGSTAWVRAADVTITSTPYRIEVSLATRHLRLLRSGQVIMDVPAGVGTKLDPTPPGQFFVAMFEAPPGAGYGPFVLVTSAHSKAISDWEGSGDAVIGIHGPLGQGSQIGSAGAALSHGCIRLQDPDLVRLRQVPVGTPVTISA